MAQSPKTVKVKIDIPDDRWAEFVKLTGETDPNKVAEIALKEFIRWREEKKSDA